MNRKKPLEEQKRTKELKTSTAGPRPSLFAVLLFAVFTIHGPENRVKWQLQGKTPSLSLILA